MILYPLSLLKKSETSDYLSGGRLSAQGAANS